MESHINWQKDFKTLFSSPLGEELLADLTAQQQKFMEEAGEATTSEEAYGLIKQAGGVKLAREHLLFRASFAPKDEGDKGEA